MADSAQRTEKPTPRRLEKARKEGQFPVSREFVSAVQFTGFVAIAVWFAPSWWSAAQLWMRALLDAGFHTELTRQSVIRLLHMVSVELMLPMLGAGALLGLLTLSTQLATTGLGIAGGKIAPDLKRLNPLTKLKNLPRQNIPMFFQAVVLLPLFCYAVWLIASSNAEAFLRLPQMELPSGVLLVATSLKDLLWKASGLFLIVGLVDLMRTRRRWMKDLRMSKQEIREEMKEVEGDPQVKMRIRRVQRDLLRRRMMKDVETATAVVVNPTHFAVALRYVPSEMPAPKVVAKGKNYLALRIRERARQHQVPIIENPPLAQALYKSAQVGQEIPAHLYRAVAEVLAYIYKLMHGRGPVR